MMFCDLVAAAEQAHMEAPASTDEDAIQEIAEPLEMIGINVGDGDSDWVRLHNLAITAAAVHRYAFFLMRRMKKSEVKKALEEFNQ